ncbi:MAG: DEAD/DEAH box helicase family protein [Clostridia bacterium]|nr:DEAD/DEAH box helicase family protein [Clostridia bacterium]
MIINPEIIKELCSEAGETRKEKAQNYVRQKKVNITKAIYDDINNFEIRSKVKGNGDIYDVHIKVENKEIEDVSCDCPDYYEHYGTCKHILATAIEFSQNDNYIKIFSDRAEDIQNNEGIFKKYRKQQEKYRNFKQLIHTFYPMHEEENNNLQQKVLPHTIKLEPKLIYNTYLKTLKLEIKIGDKQLYKLRKFPEFYDRMRNKEYYSYGTKLEFTHEEDYFRKDSLPLLNFVLKYAEIIKYTNEATNSYTYYGSGIEDNYITISNSGMDELFNVLEGKQVTFQKEGVENKILFSNKTPDIKFNIEKENENEYRIIPNIDIYEYEVIEGKENIYFLMENVLYKCDENFKNTTLKLLQVFRNNFTNTIVFPKEELSNLFSIVFPKVKDRIGTNNLNEEEIEKYVPKDLYVKLYLDYDNRNYITADIKFVYGKEEFNPLLEPNLKFARDIAKEDEVLEMFRRTGFMLEVEKARLILVSEDAIYNFLSIDIENYMKKFEVLATDNFKQKEIKQPKMTNIGVKIENNLLNIDLGALDFDPSELKEIMQKYHLKKKYHRLKDGSFINLEENETIDFIDSLSKGMGITYEELEKGELKLPIYRSLYLDRILESIKKTKISKNEEYKSLINKIEDKNFNEEIVLPQNLNAELRNYQKVGYEWLKVIDNYNFGGILADDMGLGKTIQLLSVVLNYVQKEKSPKPTIVVCPSSLTLNWENETKKFTPELTTIVIRGNSNERKKQIKSIPKYNIAITSYDLLKRDIDIYKELRI